MSFPISPHSLKSDRAIRFGQELARAMKARGVGNRTVAEATGMGRTSLHNWRAGRNLPRIETARGLAEALEWPRLAALAMELRSRACFTDGVVFIDDSGSDNRRYCSQRCQDVAGKKVVGMDTRARAGVAERRLAIHARAVAAYCNGCEPEGRCVTADCPLRPVSPLPLYADRLDVAQVKPKPHNGFRESGADSARMARVWASYTPKERAERIGRAADGRRTALAGGR